MSFQITNKVLWALLCLLPISLFADSNNTILTATIPFYSEQLTVRYNPDIILDKTVCAKTICIEDFAEEMDATNYAVILEDLQAYKEKFQLNDWLFYKMLTATLDQIYAGKKIKKYEMHYTLTTWYLMSKAGYETKLTESALQYVFLYVVTDDHIYNVPTITVDDKKFINLSAISMGWDTRGAVFRKMKKDPFKNEGTNKFSFSLDQLPEMVPMTETKEVVFKWNKEAYTINVDIDKNIVDLMEGYPLMLENEYLEVPLSLSVRQSLIPQLEEIMEGKSENEKVEIAMAFCRSAFSYKWDWDLYDDNRPMVADQLFHCDYSDHEDRVALFIQIIKETVDLPMIVMKYYDYLTVGVELSENQGTPISHEGKEYTVCEPTSPKYMHKLGKYPNGFNLKTMEVVATF